MATYEEEIEIVEGTFGKDINLQAQEEGNPVDLTGCTVKLTIYDPEEPDSYVLNATCIAVDLTQGQVKYTLQESDWVCYSPPSPTGTLEGNMTYEGALIATKVGYHEEFPGLKIKIKERAPTS